ncbi:MAG: CHASE domain-containing protein [Planctomycetota bacterium]
MRLQPHAAAPLPKRGRLVGLLARTVPILVIVLGLAVGATLYRSLRQQDRRLDDERFRALVHDADDHIRNTMGLYVEALRGGAGLVRACEDVDAEAWRTYVTTLDIVDRHPGLRGVGVVLPVPRSDLPAYAAHRATEGGAAFVFHPVPGIKDRPRTEVAFPIVYIEPHEINGGALGLDLASEFNRHDAAEWSRDHGVPRSTQEIILVQDAKARPGFLIYLPVYELGRPIGTVEERRAAFRLWIYSPLVSEEFFAGAWQAWKRRTGELECRVFAGEALDSERVIFSAHDGATPDRYAARTPVDLHGLHFTIGWRKGSEFQETGPGHAIWMALGTVFLSLAAGFFIHSFQTTGTRARAIAEGLTEDLARSEARFQAAVESAPNGVVILDEEGRVVLANKEIESIFGYDRDELIGRSVDLLIPEERKRRHPDARHVFLRNPARRSMSDAREFSGRRKDGSIVPVEVGLMPLNLAEGPHVLGGIVDVTKKVEVNRQLRESLVRQRDLNRELEALMKEAESASRAKSTFLANMSHEIRTPMNAVLGMCELLGRSELSEDQTTYVRSLRSAGESLLQLINGVLDLAKVEAGKMDLSPAPFDLRELLQSTLEVMAIPAHRQGLTIVLDRAEDLPRVVVGDAQRLRQILVNLLGNAVKFTESGRVVLAVTPRERAGEVVEIEFEVRDTGVGIAAADLPRIFQPFSQVDATTARAHGGSGLGLALCERFVRLMGAELAVESEVGVGTTLRFAPRFLVPASRGESAPHRGPAAGRSALVFVRDEVQRRVFARRLVQLGLEVDAVGSAAELANRLRERRAAGETPDLVFADHRADEGAIDDLLFRGRERRSPRADDRPLPDRSTGARPPPLPRARRRRDPRQARAGRGSRGAAARSSSGEAPRRRRSPPTRRRRRPARASCRVASSSSTTSMSTASSCNATWPDTTSSSNSPRTVARRWNARSPPSSTSS